MIKVNGTKVDIVDHEYAIKFTDDDDPLFCDDEEGAKDAYDMVQMFDGNCEMVRRTIYYTTWERADPDSVTARRALP